MANGLCDNLITNVFRAWPYQKQESWEWTICKPVIVAPAINTNIYLNPITEKQLKMLKEEMKVTVMDTQVKVLMCKDVGAGAMAKVQDII